MSGRPSPFKSPATTAARIDQESCASDGGSANCTVPGVDTLATRFVPGRALKETCPEGDGGGAAGELAGRLDPEPPPVAKYAAAAMAAPTRSAAAVARCRRRCRRRASSISASGSVVGCGRGGAVTVIGWIELASLAP